MIEFQNVSKTFGEKKVLKNISFTIQDGEIFVIVGTSGSGKTTTLKMINRLIDPSEGQIKIDGKFSHDYDLRDLRLDMGYVLQQGALFPNLTVYENVELIPEMKKWPKGERKQRILDFLDKVGLPAETYKNRYPRELSGGEQQRVGIVRAIVGKPKFILMDEPFSALDPIFKNQLQDLVLNIHKELGITIVFVTHDMREARKMGNRICVMQNGQIVQLDTPQGIEEHPANEFVARFFSEGVING